MTLQDGHRGVGAVSTDESATTTAQPAVPRREKGTRSRLAIAGGAVELGRQYGTIGLLGVLILVFSLVTSDFLTGSNWSNLLVTQSVTTCITFAALGPLVVGEFDLSLGFALGFITMIGAWVAGRGEGAATVLVVMFGTGAVIGLANGVLTVVLNISSFIATLGIGTLLSGLTLGLSGGQVLFSGVPSFILATGRNHFGGLAVSVWLVLLLTVILYYVYEHTPIGRKWYAMGGLNGSRSWPEYRLVA